MAVTCGSEHVRFQYHIHIELGLGRILEGNRFKFRMEPLPRVSDSVNPGGLGFCRGMVVSTACCQHERLHIRDSRI